jgi:hypothetical protein
MVIAALPSVSSSAKADDPAITDRSLVLDARFRGHDKPRQSTATITSLALMTA